MPMFLLFQIFPLNNENQTGVEERLVEQTFICIILNRFRANVT